MNNTELAFYINECYKKLAHHTLLDTPRTNPVWDKIKARLANNSVLAEKIVHTCQLGYPPYNQDLTELIRCTVPVDKTPTPVWEMCTLTPDSARIDNVYEPSIVFPIENTTGVYGFQYQPLTPIKNMKYNHSKDSSLWKKTMCTFNEKNALNPNTNKTQKQVYVCEGVWDAISLATIGLRAVALLGGTVTDLIIERIHNTGCTPVLALDNDTEGIKSMCSYIRKHPEYTTKLEVTTPPCGVDWNDMLLYKNTEFAAPNTITATEFMKTYHIK